VHEETGLPLGEASFLGIDSRVYTGTVTHPAVHAIRIVYKAHLLGDPKVVEVDGSVDDAAWVDLANLTTVPTVHLVTIALRMMDQGHDIG
jgi:hypothetical protein